MKLNTLLVAAFLLSTSAVAQPTPKPADDRAELERLESVWNQAHERGDAPALEQIWADDLEVAVPKMPVISRADAVSVARSGRMHFEHYQTSDVKIRIYCQAAVVTGRLQRVRTRDNQTIADDWRFTKVYIKTAGKWRVVAFHASDAAPPTS